MNHRNRLIQLIHIGKTKLGLDDDTYRALLTNISGKASCKVMNIKELESVLAEMENRGFKRDVNGSKKPFKRRLSPKSGKAKHAEIDKIRAIWITMAQQGFVRDRSEAALDTYVRRMTSRGNKQGVDHVAWCSAEQAYSVLEALKSWHRRVMIDGLKEKGWTVPMNERTGKPMSYEPIANAYTFMLNSLQDARNE